MNTIKHNKCNSYFHFWKTRGRFAGGKALFFIKTCDAQVLVLDDLLDGFEATQLVWQVERLEDVGEWSVPACDASDRSLEMQEALFLDGRGEFSAESVREWSFVRNDDSAGLLDGLKLNKKIGKIPTRMHNFLVTYVAHSFSVPRQDRNQID